MYEVDILIVGAGVSGLALGFALETSGLKFKIIERDESINGRRQGFSLTLQGRTKEFLKEFNILDEFLANGTRVKTQMFITSKGDILYSNEKNDIDRFNFPVPRQKIREIFYSKLKSDKVDWNKHVDVFENVLDKIIVTCKDGSKYLCSKLIACDGLNSRARKFYLKDIVLNDLKLMNIYGLSNIKLNPKFTELFENKEIQTLDGYNRIFIKPFDEDRSMWECTYPLDKSFDSESLDIYYKLNQGEDPRPLALEKAKNVCNKWCLEVEKNKEYIEELYELIKQTDLKDIIVHPLYDHIPSMKEIQDLPKNVFLVGDSLHPMSPVIGRGANEAFEDVFELFELLTKHRLSDNDLFFNYYYITINRVAKTVDRSRLNTKIYHSDLVFNKKEFYKFKNWTMTE